MFSLNRSSDLATTVISNVNTPSKIYVDDDEDGPTIYISVFIGNRVEKWISGASIGIQIGDECRSCFGVAVDSEKNVYMSEADRHRVVKWLAQTNSTTVVAGQTDKRGTTDEYLNNPDGLYFDRSSDVLYVADAYNNRIQKWTKNTISGIRVAGSNTSAPGDDTGSLDEPNGVWIDQQTKIIYVADTSNHRIMRWLPDASVGDIIAGGQGSGNATNQFNTPTDLTFDSAGNLYVCDNWNHRIQLFSIIDNKPCSPTSTRKIQLYHMTL
ncbi:unnamed protein product [Rotaria sp. Silwood1]|nr:unnamed protein product [Rotaria sp. Silwood1]CAF3477205.1 unnamed protein product [Rotaria sp. Silwood1]CAF4612616.1 unnamed protein product [Rotaria sp. Silwood1]CAF4747519.1 unnamed protein product [Rotaria sp. Silwood1]